MNDITLTIEHKGATQSLKLQNLDNLSAADTFLVVGPGYYGYGVSIADARKNCLKAGCPRTKKMLAFLGDASLGVTDMGYVTSQKVLINLGEV